MNTVLLLAALSVASPSPQSALRTKLALLVENPASPVPKELPGLVRFLRITGDNKDGRKLYVEMMNTHADILEAFETHSTEGNTRFDKFLAAAQERCHDADGFKAKAEATLVDHGEAALFLFVRTHPKFIDNLEHRNVLTDIVVADKFRGALAGPKKYEVVKKLFLHWLTREPNLHAVQFAFSIAEGDGVDGALSAALQIIAAKDTPNEHRAAIMITYVAKYGSVENLKDLAPFMNEKDDFGFSQLNDEPMLFCQFRDVALAVSIQISKQKLQDYGIKRKHEYGFANEAARKKAFEKWDAWTKKNK